MRRCPPPRPPSRFRPDARSHSRAPPVPPRWLRAGSSSRRRRRIRRTDFPLVKSGRRPPPPRSRHPRGARSPREQVEVVCERAVPASGPLLARAERQGRCARCRHLRPVRKRDGGSLAGLRGRRLVALEPEPPLLGLSSVRSTHFRITIQEAKLVHRDMVSCIRWRNGKR